MIIMLSQKMAFLSTDKGGMTLINELFSLEQALQAAGISAGRTAREYLLLPNATAKQPCVRVYVREDGSIKDFEAIDSEKVNRLKKYGNKQGSFPAFKIAALYRVTGKKGQVEVDKLKSLDSLTVVERAKALCLEDNWSDKLIKKTNLCLKVRAKQLADSIEKHGEGRGAAMLHLAKIAQKFGKEDRIGFRQALEECALEKLRRREGTNLALTVLFYVGKENAKDPDNDRGSLSIILDLADWSSFVYPIAGEETTKEINHILMLAEQSSLGSRADLEAKDAFGAPYTRMKESMPEVRLRGFDVVLRTMFSEHPNQMRYRTSEGDSYPLSYENRQALSAALTWLSVPEREGITWTRADKDELVFAYPSSLPSVNTAFVKLLGAKGGGKIKSELFEKTAGKFVQSFRGLPANEKPKFIQVFTLRKMDKARTKVIYSRNYDAEHYVQAGVQWPLAYKNVPQMGFGDPFEPFPLDISDIVNSVWRQDGERAGRGKPIIKRMKYYEGIELLLNPQEKVVRNYLSIMMQSAPNLALCASRLKLGKSVNRNYLGIQESAKTVSTVLGILLFKCGRRKEKYMEETAYLLGQILKVSDELHALYGKIVRNNDVPPQLAGNSFYLMASDMPMRALAQLGVRMMPYLTWAKSYATRNKQDSGLAGDYLSLYESFALKMKAIFDHDIKFGDSEKAELFLGYLASLPSVETPRDR